MFIYLTVYGNAGVTHSDPNAITKRLFPARVREMHRNGNEGFEEEFQVRLKKCLSTCVLEITYCSVIEYGC